MNEIVSFDLYDYHHKSKHEILLSYKGPFEITVLDIIANYINVILNQNQKLSKKMLKIFIELAQNVAYYSSEKNAFGQETAGVGSVAIIETPEFYTLHAGNLIGKQDMEGLISRCELINSLDLEGLRAYRRKQMELPDGCNDTANIGLIQIAITSANPLKFKVTENDEKNSFFAISVQIDK